MATLKQLPISNDGNAPLQLALEPEGDVIMLEPGTTCSVRFPDLGDSDDADLEISWEEGLLSIHLSATKQVWIDDKRVR